MSTISYELNNQEWWVQRWVDLLNSYRFKKRLERGRIYAREGNILSLEFQGAEVQAKVQGTAPEPYELSISIDPFTDEDWDYVIDTMAQKAVYSAKLLAGEMPSDIEEVFTSNGLSLFPFALADVHSRCSCPDPKNPCKHIAAVYYQLGDFFREDPFVLFQLRGRTRGQILEALRKKRSGSDSSATTPDTTADLSSLADVESEPAHQPSNTLDLHHFWDYSEPLDPSLVVIAPSGTQTVLDVLGKMPFAATEAQTVRQHLDNIYQAVSQYAMVTALSRNE
jgi:uncharacterized Zn finger protein